MQARRVSTVAAAVLGVLLSVVGPFRAVAAAAETPPADSTTETSGTEPTAEQQPAPEPGPDDAAQEIPGVDGVDRGLSDTVARVYLAALDRVPDADGLAYWVDLYIRGLPLTTIGEAFLGSPEWTSAQSDLDDDGFVVFVYDSVFGRAPDAEGADYWRSQLASGYPRVSLLLSLSESTEFISDTGTESPVAPPPPRFPAPPADSGVGRRVIYVNSAQRVWLVGAEGLVEDVYPVSGRRMTPGPGTYEVFSKSPMAWAGHDGITMQWMVRFAHGDDLAIGFHAIPRRSDGTPIQSESQLGTFRSAGCVRQADAKAEALYAWADIGTTVVVLP